MKAIRILTLITALFSGAAAADDSTQATSPVSLTGEKAVAQLKESGQYDSVAAAYEAARHAVRPDEAEPDGVLHAQNPGHGLSASFDRHGLQLSVQRHGTEGERLTTRWRLDSVGRDGAVEKVPAGDALRRDGQRAEIVRGGLGLTEWFVNRPSGLEHGFTLDRRPAGEGALRLDIAIEGDLSPVPAADGQRIELHDAAGAKVLDYDKLRVWDAAGQELPAHMEQSEAGGLRFRVEDAGARYPLTVDPTFTQQAYLKASNSGADDYFGTSVAVSGDTVVVGAWGEDSSTTGINSTPNESAIDAGAAYVFVRSGSTWTQQAYLKASNTGADDRFGFSVAVSGNTVVVGAVRESSSTTGINSTPNESASAAGAAYVFVRSGSTWSQQAYLKASNSGDFDQFGWSVAVSDDTAVIGAVDESSNATTVNGDETNNSATRSGAAYVFTRSGTTWSQQAYLKASNTGDFDQFGTSVAVSGDTAVIGAMWEDSNANTVNGVGSDSSLESEFGAAYVFTRSGTTWSQQAYLKASNSEAGDVFGYSVAVFGDTVVVGAYGDDSNATTVNGNGSDNSATFAGAAYVFTRSGTTWSQQTYLKARNTGEYDFFGYSVAVFGDTAVIAALGEGSNATTVNGDDTNNSAYASGAAYVFTRSGSTWSQQAYLKASNSGADDYFGFSVAVSSDTVVIGATQEASSTTGINSTPNESAGYAGAAYVFSVIPDATLTTAAYTGSNPTLNGGVLYDFPIVSDSQAAPATLSITSTSAGTVLSGNVPIVGGNNINTGFRTDINLTLNPGESVVAQTISLTTGQFDDGLRLDYNGLTVLDFDFSNWNVPAVNSMFGGAWTPWTNEGSPTMELDADGLRLMVTAVTPGTGASAGVSAGSRINVLDYFTSDAYVRNPANPDFVSGVQIGLYSRNNQGAWAISNATMTATARLINNTPTGLASLATGTTQQINTTWFRDAQNGFIGTDGGGVRVTTNGGQTWTTSTTGVTNNIYAIRQADGVLFLAGANGLICRSTDNGVTWTTQATATTATFRGLAFSSATRGFAVGTGGTICIYNGTTWVAQNSGTTADFTGVSIVGNTAWAVGAGGVICRYNGTSWAAVNSGATGDFYGVSFLSENLGFAVGANGLLCRYNGTAWQQVPTGVTSAWRSVFVADESTIVISGDGGLMCQSTDGGQTWQTLTVGSSVGLTAVGVAGGQAFAFGTGGAGFSFTVRLPTGLVSLNTGTEQQINTTWFSDAQNGLIGTDGGVVRRTTDGGRTWTASNTGITSNIYAIRKVGTVAFFAGANGVICRSNDNGVTWTAQTTGTTATFRALAFSSATSGFAVGTGGTICVYNGTTWTAQTSGTTAEFTGVSIVGNTAWAVGAGGVICRYNGTSWATVTSGVTIGFTSVSFLSGNLGYAVGDGGLICRYNGTAWVQVNSGVTAIFRSVVVVDDSTIVISGDNGLICQSTDGGQTWQTFSVGSGGMAAVSVAGGQVFTFGTGGAGFCYTISLPSGLVGLTTGTQERINATDFSDAQNGLIGTNGGGVRRTSDGGRTWTTSTTGITSDIYAIRKVGAVAFFAGANGVICRSTDNGATWTAQATGTTQCFKALAFSSATSGFAVGTGGTICVYNGTTWTAQTSGTTAEFTGVSIVGNTAWAVGAGGVICRYNGTSWQPVNTGVTIGFTSVSFLRENLGYAVGAGGVICRYDGTSWVQVTSGLNIIFRSVVVADENTIVISGDGGLICQSTDGGLTWQTLSVGSAGMAAVTVAGGQVFTFGTGGAGYCYSISPPSGLAGVTTGTQEVINAASFSDAQNGLIATDNGGVRVTTNGGQTWTNSNTGVTSNINAISQVDGVAFLAGANGVICRYNGTTWVAQATGTTTEVFQGLAFSSATSGFAVGTGGTICIYNGTTWVRQTTGTTADFTAVSIVGTTAWAVGNGGIICRYNGTSWAPVNSGVTTNFYAVDFLRPDFGFAVGAGGVICRYNGTAWVAVNSGVTTAFRSVVIVDDSTIVISGDGGLVCRSTDGGQTWQTLAVGSSASLNALVVAGGEVLAFGDGGAGFAFFTAPPQAAFSGGQVVGGNFVLGTAGSSGNTWPAGNPPASAFDGSASTKFVLNQTSNAALLVNLSSPAVRNRLAFTTANDFPECDPASYRIYGFSTPPPASGSIALTSLTLIQEGTLALPTARSAGPSVVQFTNDTAYISYLIVFPAVRNVSATATQVAEARLFQGESVFRQVPVGKALGGSFVGGTFASGNSVPDQALDGTVDTKFSIFQSANAAIVVSPESASGAVINAISLWTAEDVIGRDPTSYAVYGSTTLYTGSGGVTWTSLGSAGLLLPDTRRTGPVTVLFENRAAYRTYMVVFPTKKSAPESITQFSEIAFADIPRHTAQITRAPGGNPLLLFNGIASQSYHIQRSTDLLNWSIIHTATADANGTLTYTDSSPPAGRAYYRIAIP